MAIIESFEYVTGYCKVLNAARLAECTYLCKEDGSKKLVDMDCRFDECTFFNECVVHNAAAEQERSPQQ